MKRVQHERFYYKKCAVRRKAAAKKGTMKRVKQKMGQKWTSKTKKVQHENSVTWRKLQDEKRATHKKLHREKSKRVQHKKVQLEKSAIWKSAIREKCNTKQVQHKKSVTWSRASKSATWKKWQEWNMQKKCTRIAH